MKFQIPNFKFQINSNYQNFNRQNCFKVLIIGISVIICYLVFGAWNFTYASTNIDSGSFNHWAWNDTIGWIDFNYTGSNVYVYSDRLESYASSSVGYIALNCNSTPNGNICNPPTLDFKVSNDSSGHLTGWAWNDGIGWISFCGGAETSDCPGSISYQVTISPSTGDFIGWAWNDIVGWFSFNCYNSGIGDTCQTSNYKVKTAWRTVAATGTLISSIFDTQATNGVAINTIMWQGNKPSETVVKFQIASSNSSSGTWTYLGPNGSDTDYYTPTADNRPVQINLAQHNNKKYFRYKIFLESNAGQTASPRVDDVIINWSP